MLEWSVTKDKKLTMFILHVALGFRNCRIFHVPDRVSHSGNRKLFLWLDELGKADKGQIAHEHNPLLVWKKGSNMGGLKDS